MNRTHYNPKLTVKMDTAAGLHSLSNDRQYSAASSRDEYRRRSPSPMASPTSSSPPPGFETVSLQRAVAKGVARAQSARERDIMYRSRICRGPDVTNNFAKRIAYRDKAQISGKAPALSEESGREVPWRVGEGLEGEMVKVEESALEAAEQKRWGKEEVGEVECGTQPAIVPYNTSNALSFEDLSRRLVAEVASNRKVGNETRSAMDNNEVERDVNGVHDGFVRHSLGVGTDDDGDNDDSEEVREHTCVVPNQDAVSELSKWFGRISASTHQETQCEEASFMPLDAVEREMIRSGSAAPQESSEELDSALVPFFNTIRNQAIDEQTDVTLENGDMPEHLHGDRPSNAVENYFGSRPDARENINKTVRGEEADRLETSEVEQFFQLFTDGKPVQGRTETTLGSHKILTSAHGYAGQNLTSSNTSSTEKQGSDHGELERWFRALASENRFEG